MMALSLGLGLVAKQAALHLLHNTQVTAAAMSGG
jgi:hypothetical protein